MTSAADIITPPGGALVRGGRIFIQDVAPAQAVNGDLWFDTVGQAWKQFILNAWQNVGGGGGGPGLPVPIRQGQFLVAGAGLNWQPGDADAGRF